MRQGFIKVAALTPKVTVADTQANREEICRLMDEAEAKGAKILVFPELCITGYTCGDLFYQQVLLHIDRLLRSIMKELQLKYGCNPNQKPSRIYMEEGELPIEVLNGRPGYINFLDALNSWQLVQIGRASCRERV